MTSALMPTPCAYCGGIHTGTCPRVKRIEYHPNGTVASVEFHAQATPQAFNFVGTMELDREEIARLIREEFDKRGWGFKPPGASDVARTNAVRPARFISASIARVSGLTLVG